MRRRTERQRMLVHVLSKTGGSKRTYLFRVKLQVQKNGEKKKVSAGHTDICKTTNVCLMRVSSTNVKVLKHKYEMICKSKQG